MKKGKVFDVGEGHFQDWRSPGSLKELKKQIKTFRLMITMVRSVFCTS